MSEPELREIQVCMVEQPLKFTKVGNVLYFQGTGLNPGVWTGIDGHTTEYSTSLIQGNAEQFAPKKVKTITSVHENKADDVVGWTTGIAPNKDGGVDVEGYIFEQGEIKELENLAATGVQIGLSPELKAPSLLDATKGYWVAQELEVKAYNFVKNPACKTCWVSSTEIKKLSGGPVSGLGTSMSQTPAAGEKGGQGENPKMGDPKEGVPKTFGEAVALFEKCPELSDADKKVIEFHTFLSAKVKEGKTLEESVEMWRKLGKPVEPQSQPAVQPAQPLFDEAKANKLLAAAATVESFVEAQRLATIAKATELVGKIKEIDKTFDEKRFLAALGDGNEAIKLDLLMQYHATVSHYKSTLPELRRELSTPDGTQLDRIAKQFFGAEKFDLDAMAKAMG